MNNLTAKSNRTLAVIILAAGLGDRLMPITASLPKPLVKISENTSILEHNLQKITEIRDVTKIYIITGHLHEKISFFIEEFKSKGAIDIELVHNHSYYCTNNISSILTLYDRSDMFDSEVDAFIIFDGDVIIQDGCVQKLNEIKTSSILTHKIMALGEWYFVNNTYRISETFSEQYYMCGISFFETADFLNILYNCKKANMNSYWDEISIKYLADRGSDLENRSDERLTYEVDTIEDLLKYIGYENASIIANQISEDDTSIKLGGMTNVNYLINIGGEAFVLRLPGKGTDKFINREREELIYKLVANSYYSVVTKQYGMGQIKLAKYVRNCKYFDYNATSALLALLDILSGIHKIQSNSPKARRLLYEEVLKYENITRENRIDSKILSQYKRLRAQVLDILMDADKDDYVLTHGDLTPENILVDKKNNIYLIDFEYSGLASPYWDYASLIAENNIPIDNPIICSLVQNQRMLLKYLLLVEFVWSSWTICKISEGDASLNTYLSLRMKKCKKWLKKFRNMPPQIDGTIGRCSLCGKRSDEGKTS